MTREGCTHKILPSKLGGSGVEAIFIIEKMLHILIINRILEKKWQRQIRSFSLVNIYQ